MLNNLFPFKSLNLLNASVKSETCLIKLQSGFRVDAVLFAVKESEK